VIAGRKAARPYGGDPTGSGAAAPWLGVGPPERVVAMKNLERHLLDQIATA
jgi:hypothetical protein